MIKRNQIFIGTIKKCKNYERYMKDGDKSYIGEFSINKTKYGTVLDNVDIIDSYAALIKVTDDKYICIQTLKNFIEDFVVDMGFSIKVLGINPEKDGDLFVDESDLMEYYSKSNEENISVRKLRKEFLIDPRIPKGIDN